MSWHRFGPAAEAVGFGGVGSDRRPLFWLEGIVEGPLNYQ